MLDSIIDAFIDTIKMIPYLFVAFLILEFLEHKLSHKNEAVLKKEDGQWKSIGDSIDIAFRALGEKLNLDSYYNAIYSKFAAE